MAHHPPAFTGRIISVSVEQIRLPNGVPCTLEIVHHPGGAAVVALGRDRRVCLLRQFRPAVNDWLWELPAGKREPGEPPLVTARRELADEAGVRAGRWQPLGVILSSPGVFTEEIHLYLARELEPAAARHEPEELFERHWVEFTEALALAQRGEICDAKTLVGLYRTAGALG